MKIARRSFLSLVVGGAVGTALTPIALKLQDDIAIWSQSFKGFPNEVPSPARGAISYENSVCSLCPGGCGISVRKAGDRAVKIEGRKEHPVNDGGICLLGLSGLQLHYGPWRVKSPMKKENGQWRAISWETALSEISGQLRTIRDKGQAHQIAAIAKTGDNITGRLLERFLTAFGSPNFFTVPTSREALALAAEKLLNKPLLPGFDLENSDYILSFAGGLMEGWGSPVRMMRAGKAWKNSGARLVQVETRLSNTAARADTWIPVNPGTEAELALGLAHIIIRDRLYHESLLSEQSAFEDLKQFLKFNYTPSTVARATGVDETTMDKLARDFAKATKPVAVCGRDSGQTPLGVNEAIAVMTLNLLVGNINRQGGMFLTPAPDYIQWEEPRQDDAAARGLAQARLDGTDGDRQTGMNRLFTRLPQMINNEEQSPVQALLVCEVNPVYTLHDTAAVEKAFKKIPLVVTLATYMDETAAAGDYILPTPSYLERFEDIPVTAGLKAPLIGLSRPVVKGSLDTRHPGDIIIALSRSLGGTIAGSMAWKNHQSCLEQTLGGQWREISQTGYIKKYDSDTAYSIMPGKEKIDFSALIKAGGQAVAPEGQQGDFPLLLIPYDSIRIAGGDIGTPPFMLKTVSDEVLIKNDVLVEINPVTAAHYGLVAGRPAILKTPRGSARVRLHLTEGIVPGVVAMPRGLGHVAYDDYLADKGVNVNSLIGPVEDPLSGFDAAWGIRAGLSNA